MSYTFSEQSTFVPTVFGGSAAGTTTYTTQNGYYIRTGNLCWITFIVSFSSATGTGNVTIGGFPFTIKNVTNGNPYGSVIWSSVSPFPVGSTTLVLNGIVNTTTAILTGFGSASGIQSLQLANNGTTVLGSLTYQI